jgi:hypothetical protein
MDESIYTFTITELVGNIYTYVDNYLSLLWIFDPPKKRDKERTFLVTQKQTPKIPLTAASFWLEYMNNIYKTNDHWQKK